MVKSHNSVKRKSGNNDGQPKERRCNCRDKAQCPMDGNCQISSIVYKATVQITGEDRQKEYIGLMEPEFKKRYGNHLTSFRHERHEKSTELSKCVWNLKRQNNEYSLGWSVIAQTPGYSNITKRCPLCLREKLEILQADKRVNINKRSELVSKCRHEISTTVEHRLSAHRLSDHSIIRNSFFGRTCRRVRTVHVVSHSKIRKFRKVALYSIYNVHVHVFTVCFLIRNICLI